MLISTFIPLFLPSSLVYLSYLNTKDKPHVQHDSIDCAIEILNSELVTVAEWFDSNKLTLSVNKTQMLMMSRKKNLKSQGDVILRNGAIQRVTKTTFLGVNVDQHLNLKDHISMVSHKISKSRGIITYSEYLRY